MAKNMTRKGNGTLNSRLNREFAEVVLAVLALSPRQGLKACETSFLKYRG